QAKLQNLVAQAFYTPSWMVDRLMSDQNTAANISYVKIPFNKATLTDVEVSGKQIMDYMKENKSRYYTEEENKILEYMVITVQPTAQDSVEIMNQIRDLKAQFAATDNDTTFVLNNEGTFQTAYQYRETLPAIIADSAYTKPKGSIIGPYTLGNNVSIAKIIDRKIIPDSVRSRHILFMAQTQ